MTRRTAPAPGRDATIEAMAPPPGMVVRLLALAFAATLAACQSSSAPAPTVDAMPHADAAIGVMCASNLCSTSTGCCAAAGAAPSCVTAGQSCAGKLMMCDGPEDCGTGTSCCVLTAGGTSCQSATQCEADGFIACNADVDCPGDLPSCCDHACASECHFW